MPEELENQIGKQLVIAGVDTAAVQLVVLNNKFEPGQCNSA